MTRTVRGLRSEVPVGKQEGLPSDSVISCDNIHTIPKSRLDPEPVGMLDMRKTKRLDEALRYALQIHG